MNTLTQLPVDVNSPVFIERKMRVERQFASGVSWFTWIAALSAINTVLYAFKIDFLFVFGLGATQLVDALIHSLVEELGSSTQAGLMVRIAGVITSLVIAGLIYLIGYFAKRRMKGVLVAGMVLYILDGLIFLLARDYLGGIFHLYVLYGLYRGFQAGGLLEQIEERIRAAHPYAAPVEPTIEQI
ncbi:MAG TPA: hypothetical protein VMT46_13765 [Anaerolineaceae bacterium]|nr:hypothetical protein [Anaerolineaceae bacterium]